jgi:hypothetical protein
MSIANQYFADHSPIPFDSMGDSSYGDIDDSLLYLYSTLNSMIGDQIIDKIARGI